ncbi:MAG: RNA methyltransferase [Fibrobacter sp.]|nr:RNA methyltransferase [Fibrobacter sp.]
MRSLKWYKSLSLAKERNLEGFFLVEGQRAVGQILQRFPDAVNEILVSNTFAERSLETFKSPRVLTDTQFGSISTSRTPQGIIAVVKIPPDYSSIDVPAVPGTKILLLEHIQDPGNVGTLVRTAAALDYDGVILSDQCADLFSPKTVQATAGALLSLWSRRTSKYTDLIRSLISNGYTMCAAEVNGNSHVDFSKLSRHIIALGNEGAGLSKEILSLAQIRFRIPFNSSNVESLNVAVSGAIAMFAGANNTGW